MSSYESEYLQEKDAFLNDLEQMNHTKSRKSKAFSCAKLKQKQTAKVNKEFDEIFTKYSTSDSEEENSSIKLEDNDWDLILNKFQELSPIEDITDSDKREYLKDTKDKYEETYKKEKSMINNILSDLEKRSKLINTEIINRLKNKSPGKVSDLLVKLIEASEKLDGTKLKAIHDLVEIKTKEQDQRRKDSETNKDEKSVDSLADSFYKSIMQGGRKNFVKASMQDSNTDGKEYDNDNEANDYGEDFNLTQIAVSLSSEYENDSSSQSDIDNRSILYELKNGETVLVKQFDSSYRFAAIDDKNREIECELPSSFLLQSIRLDPRSPYAYDKYGRRYRVISEASILNSQDGDDSDDSYLDDDEYDKYEYSNRPDDEDDTEEDMNQN